MYIKAVVVASVLAIANALTVNTPPSLVVCQPASISWSNGTAPYYIAILPGGETSATALVNLPNADASPTSWTVNIAAGTSVTIRVTDASGVPAYTSALTIQAGSSTSCLTSSSASASASGSASASASGTASASGSGSATSSTAAKSSGAALLSKEAGGMYALLGLVAAGLGVLN